MAGLDDTWLIRGVVLGSMTLQVVLAFGGSLRHRSSCRVLQLLMWLAYTSADVVAMYALGTMAHESSHSRIFGVWAPLLLVHLGGPDTITAYSRSDNELWRRHLVTMLSQVSVAIYVMYICEMQMESYLSRVSYLSAAAGILLIVGFFKYAEKTMALRLASKSQTVNSCQPIHQYMSLTQDAPCKYAVMGLKKWERKEGNYAVISIHDVLEHEHGEATENYILCLSHALFKMIMRRYADLPSREIQRAETRRFFFEDSLSHLTSEKIFPVIEMQLKFMFDALFSKSIGTAFSKWGTIMRIINICLLGLGGFLIYGNLVPGEEKEEGVDEIQRKVTYIVISVELMVELLQLLRIVASDWTLVWLICSDIHSSRSGAIEQGRLAQLKHKALLWLGRLRRMRGRHYWKKSIQRYSLIDTCESLSPCKWKLAQSLNLTDFVTSWYIKSEPVEDDFKKFILDKVKGIFSNDDSTEICRERIDSYNNILRENLRWASTQGHERLILHWHIATTICWMEFPEDGRVDDPEIGNVHRDYHEEIKRNAGVSRTISNYCAYLLVSSPDLLPVHSDIARMEYVKVHSELLHFLSSSKIQELKYYKRRLDESLNYEGESVLANGARLARKLLQIETPERWGMLSDYWAAVLIYYADLKNPMVHAEHLTVGGEFITHLWALLGNMGFGTGKV